MPWMAATAGLAVMVVTPLSSGESRSSGGARLDAIGLPGILGEIERQFQPRRAGWFWLVPIALIRAASAGDKGTIRLVSGRARRRWN